MLRHTVDPAVWRRVNETDSNLRLIESCVKEIEAALADVICSLPRPLLFLEDSIWQLLPDHEGKLALKALDALSIYDIEL